jgi:hypothetical protein
MIQVMRNLVVILLFMACSSPKENIKEEVQQQSEAKGKIFSDTLFYKKDAMEFDISKINNAFNNKKHLIKVDEDVKKQLMGCFDFSNNILNAYYYSAFAEIGELTAIVFLLNTMESNYLILATISNDSDILTCIQLTEEHCDLVKQDEDKEEIWCDSKIAYKVQSQNLKIIRQHIVKMDYGSHTIIKKDSITSVYEITDEGRFNPLRIDSVRLE